MWIDSHRNICRFQCLNWIEVYSWYAALSLVRDHRDCGQAHTQCSNQSVLQKAIHRLKHLFSSKQVITLLPVQRSMLGITCTFYSHILILMSSHLRPDLPRSPPKHLYRIWAPLPSNLIMCSCCPCVCVFSFYRRGKIGLAVKRTQITLGLGNFP